MDAILPGERTHGRRRWRRRTATPEAEVEGICTECGRLADLDEDGLCVGCFDDLIDAEDDPLVAWLKMVG